MRNEELGMRNEGRAKGSIRSCVILLSLLITHFSFLIVFVSCASGGAVSAEEYFAIGMAYYDMGKFEEAEKWLNRARAKDKTQSASAYNLGRIAFETGRYDEAIRYFEGILKRDPDNIMALKAAAYTRIRNGDIEKAEALYSRLLTLVPDSADDGYNHALVLFAMEKYEQAEQVLAGYEFALLDNNDVLLLYARTQKELGKPEAIDSYAAWLANNTDVKVRYEYARLLESHELYAKALEEYRLALEGLGNSKDVSKKELRFSIGHVLLIADGENSEGLAELKGAVDDGFDDFDAMEEILNDERISAANKDSVRTIIADGRRAAEAAAAAAEAAAEAAAAEAAVKEEETDEDKEETENAEETEPWLSQ